MSVIRYRPKRPKGETGATVPSTGDVALIDGPSGVRGLDMAYFTDTFAPVGAGYNLIAGTNIQIIETSTHRVIYKVEANTGFDDLELDTAGSVSVLEFGVGWTDPAYLSVIADPNGYDDLESDAAGAVTELGNGLGWAGVGAVLSIEDFNGGDDFELYATGTITALTAGSNWNGTGEVSAPT